MGKKMKKGPSPRKAQHRTSTGSPISVIEGSGGDGDSSKKACNHYTKSSIDLNRILGKIRSSSMDVAACEQCREEPVNRRGGKEKGKHQKKKGAVIRTTEAKSCQNWVCLDCGRIFCGGVSIFEPYGHARRHSKKEQHQWAVRADDPLISWCYSCSSSVPIEMPEEVVKEDNEVFMNVMSCSLRGIAVEPLDLKKLKGHKVRGLSNLGNTCFFNSVMQNLLALDLLRDTLLGLDMSAGPLAMALRILFTETSKGADSKGVINPKALFGCICAKAPQFRGYQQQDSHELLRYLLDGLHVEEINCRNASELGNNEEKSNTKTKSTLVDAIFSGQLLSSVSCMECQHTSVVNEPFLDLSLPVPSKKHPSKTVPSHPPKKANQREKSKSRQFKESCVAQLSTLSANQKVEGDEQSSECGESGIVAPMPTHDDALEAQNFSWMDYLGVELPNCTDFNAPGLEASAMRCSYNEQANNTVSNDQSISELHNETESHAQPVSELHTCSLSNDLTASSDTFVKRSCNDEVLHSYDPVPGVILLPYKEQDFTGLDINDRTLFSQDLENIQPIDFSVNESCAANSSCKQADEEFDGFGDLFNEPEVTSHLNVEANVADDMDITLWAESNLEEVDDMSAPVSINSCLALFTKPEILSDEQAWYCERCSEMSQENWKLGAGKLQAAEVSDISVTVKSGVDDDEFQSKKIETNSLANPSNAKVLNNEKLVSSSNNGAVLSQECFDQCANASQKQYNHTEGSQNIGETNCNENSHFVETTSCINVASCSHVLDKDMWELETSQYLSGRSVHINNQVQDCSSNHDSNFNIINDQSSVDNDGKKPKVASHTNISMEKSNVDRSQKISRVRKKGLKPGKVDPAKDKGEGIRMVKRDAIKRILIDKLPPILTIHLKRFSQDARGRSTKLSGHVGFQEMLDLRPYMDPRCIEDRSLYRLIGLVEHSGSMNGGHYVAYVRGDGKGSRSSTGSSGQAWFYVSDAHVREVSLAEVLQSEAYILFYERI